MIVTWRMYSGCLAMVVILVACVTVGQMLSKLNRSSTVVAEAPFGGSISFCDSLSGRPRLGCSIGSSPAGLGSHAAYGVRLVSRFRAALGPV
jgi:hypothetical protein